MAPNSLAVRLFLSATAWTVIILLATGVSLSSLYRGAVERSFDRRLSVYLRELVAEVAAPDDGPDRVLSLGEPLFELPLSGWYWQVVRLNAAKPETRVSRSLWDRALPHLADRDVPATSDGTRRSYAEGPEEQRLRMVERTVDLGEEGRYLVSVAGDPQEIEEETRAFNQTIIITFFMLAAVLLLTTMFQVRYGLAPLKRISESLAAIRAGRSERLEGRFPVEIAPLARETNALIEANRDIVERARTHVGNLAHALKTPLSVIINEAGHADKPFGDKVREQAGIMRDQIARHLERARLAARLTVVGDVTDAGPVVGALARTMEKLHHDRGILIDLHAPHPVRFHGERQDLEEMVGNLVDNACKWAASRVAIEVAAERRAEKGGTPILRIVVDDDGPGLTAAEREQVVAQRGQRLDETKPGSGLGLSIVLELAALYDGSLSLSTAPIGGLRAELALPAV